MSTTPMPESTPKPTMSPDYIRAAQNAIQVQDACNLSGIAFSFHAAIEAVCERCTELGQGTRWKNTHPIVTLYLLKMAELNGCGSSLDPAYKPAEEKCKLLAQGCEVAGL